MMDIEQALETLDEEFAFFSRMVTEHLSTLSLTPGARILDVGTGMGRLAITLALHGYRVITGEPADDHSEYAKQAWRDDARRVGADEAITYQPFDATRLPFEAASFDGIFMMGALHHMDNRQAAIRECLRVLAPSGVFSILEPNAQLVELARTRHPTHPDPTDPRPFLQDLPVSVSHCGMFDVYVVTKPVNDKRPHHVTWGVPEPTRRPPRSAHRQRSRPAKRDR